MTIYDKIRKGAYTNTLPFSTFKKDPVVGNAHRAEDMRLYEQFKQDLFEEFDVQSNPRREQCFQKAWALGHAYGYMEVVNYFEDLVELIKPL